MHWEVARALGRATTQMEGGMGHLAPSEFEGGATRSWRGQLRCFTHCGVSARFALEIVDLPKSILMSESRRVL
jgi:hypothetical protein